MWVAADLEPQRGDARIVSVTDAGPAAAPDKYHELTTLKFRNIPDAEDLFLANNALI